MTLQDLANISQIAQAILVIISLGFIWLGVFKTRSHPHLALDTDPRFF